MNNDSADLLADDTGNLRPEIANALMPVQNRPQRPVIENRVQYLNPNQHELLICLLALAIAFFLLIMIGSCINGCRNESLEKKGAQEISKIIHSEEFQKWLKEQKDAKKQNGAQGGRSSFVPYSPHTSHTRPTADEDSEKSSAGLPHNPESHESRKTTTSINTAEDKEEVSTILLPNGRVKVTGTPEAMKRYWRKKREQQNDPRMNRKEPEHIIIW